MDERDKSFVYYPPLTVPGLWPGIREEEMNAVKGSIRNHGLQNQVRIVATGTAAVVTTGGCVAGANAAGGGGTGGAWAKAGAAIPATSTAGNHLRSRQVGTRVGFGEF